MPPRAPTPPHDEVITAVPTGDALAQAHIQAMRSMSDQMALLSHGVMEMGSDLKQTRDAVLKLEAQELKSTIVAVRTEALASIERLRDDHDALIAKLRADLEAEIKEAAAATARNSGAISNIRGIFLPLSALGAGAVAFVGMWLANVLSGLAGAMPPHHP